MRKHIYKIVHNHIQIIIQQLIKFFNQAFGALDVFGSEQLPLYVILKPKSDDTIEVVGIYSEGKINDVEGFKKFLADPLAK